MGRCFNILQTWSRSRHRETMVETCLHPSQPLTGSHRRGPGLLGHGMQLQDVRGIYSHKINDFGTKLGVKVVWM